MDQPNPIDLYRRAMQRCIAVAEGIEPSQLDDPTPCSEWNVQQLLDHLVGGTAYLRTASGDEVAPPEGAAPGDLRVGVDACLALLAQPDLLERTCQSPLGFEWTVGQAVAGTFMVMAEPLGFWAGMVIVVLGGVVGAVMSAMGLGQPKSVHPVHKVSATAEPASVES